VWGGARENWSGRAIVISICPAMARRLDKGVQLCNQFGMEIDWSQAPKNGLTEEDLLSNITSLA